MDPDRVGHYLQAACAGLGFDIGEVWITSSNSGASTVASIEDKSQNGSAAKKYNRFLQLYTSKSYDDQRCNLLTPQSQKKSPFLRRNGSNGDFDDESSIEKHVLSPRLVDAISTSMQVVWANCQKREGLLGRSDMCLQTAVGMPVAVDSNGNICSVIMFSRYDIKSNEDALEYLQFISRSATTSIPCLLPVIENKSESEQINNRLMQIPTSTGKPSSMPVNLPDGVTARFVSFNDKEGNNNAVSDKNLSIEARPSRDVKAAPKDCFGIPMLPSFAEIGYDEEDVTPDPSPISIISDDVFDEASYGVWSTIMENQTKNNNNNKKKEAEVATFSSKADQTQTKPVETSRTQEKADGFENKSNLTPSSKQSSSSTLSVKLEPILSPRKIEQLEEFITAFLGMSVFDIADVWMPENNDGFGSLTHVSTVTTNSSVSGVIEDFRRISKETTIKSWSGAVGRAFGSGNPVWSSNRDVIVDTGRAEAFQRANIQTVLAFPINSSDRDIYTPVCVLACYSFLRIDSVPYILRFVQQALRLLWDGLDHVVPHSSVGQDLWKEVAPADLGEMAADVEMQKAFLTKKRSFGTLTAITDTTTGATLPPPVEKSQDVPTTRSSFKSIRLEDEPGYFVDPAELAAAETSSSNNNNNDDGSKNNNSAMENNNIDWLKMQHHVQEAVKSIGEAIPWSNRNSIIASNDEGQRTKRVCIVQSNIQQAPSSNSYNIMEQQIPQVKTQVNGVAINNNLPTRVTPPVQPSGVLSSTNNNHNNNNENPATSNAQQQQQQPPLKQFLPSLGPISSHGGLINRPGATATPLFAPRKVLSPASLTIPAPLHLNNMNTNPNNMTMMHVNYQENNTKKNSDTNNNSNNNNFFPHSILPPPNAHGAREKLDVALKNIEEFNALARMGGGVGIGAMPQTHKQVQATQKQVQTQEPKANNNNTNVKNVLNTEAPKTMTSQFPAVPPLPQYTNHNNNNNPNNINISTPNPHQQQAASFIYPQATTPLQFCVPIQPGAQKSSETTTKPGVKLCRIQGCNDPVVSRRPYCTKHSGSRLCEYPDCKKCAQGATRFCIAHGGGRRCTFPGCDKGARDKFFCAAHGGGKRCKHQGCTKSAVGGSNLCTSHGGGKRCIVEGCTKSAQSSTKFCVKHGGGKKCITPGCNKVARGKTKHCAAHGGGIRCTLPNCNRVAIGKFQLCRMHGGGSKKSKQAQAQTQVAAAAAVGGENVQTNFNAFQFPPLSNYPPNSSSSTTPPPPPLPPPSHHSL